MGRRFKPTQQYLNKAKEAYYKRGGTTTILPYVEKSAETIVYMALSNELSKTTGKYFHEKKEINSSPASYSKEAALKLWQLSLKLTGFSYP